MTTSITIQDRVVDTPNVCMNSLSSIAMPDTQVAIIANTELNYHEYWSTILAWGGLASAIIISLTMLAQYWIAYGAATLNARARAARPFGSKVPVCDDCWCVRGTGEQCPAWTPENISKDPRGQSAADYTYADLSQKVKFFTGLIQDEDNVMTLDCDPYANSKCETTPPQAQKEDGQVCAYKYNKTSPGKYSMITYSSEEKAKAEDAFITHHGKCGVCSTAQDLAVYMNDMDLTASGKWSAMLGNFYKKDAGIQSFKNIGFSEPCATMWYYNTVQTSKMCKWTCLKEYFKPLNLKDDQCRINDCLQCDEDKSGQKFQEFAARTRRNSGLFSEIQRPCDQPKTVIQKIPEL